MKVRLHPILKKSIRVLALLSAALAISLVALWFLRAKLLTYAAKRSLQDLGIPHPELTVTAANLDSLSVEDISLDTPQGSISIDRLDLTFSLSELRSVQRIQNLILTHVQITIPLPSTNNESTSSQFTLPQLPHQPDLSPYFPLPFNRIQILDSSLTLTSPHFDPITTALEATLSASTPDTLSLQALLTRPSENLSLSSELSPNAPYRLDATLHLDSPTNLLDTYLPDWKSTIPDLHSLSSGPLELTARIHSSTTANHHPIAFSLSSQNLALTYEEVDAQFSRLQADGYFQTADTASDLHLKILASPQHLVRDTIALASHETIDLQLKLHELNALNLKTNTPLTWNYDSTFATGSTSLDLYFDLAESSIPLHGSVITENLIVSEIQLQPNTLNLDGNLEALAFTASPIALANAPSPLTTNGHGTLHIPEPDDQPITLAFTAQFHPTAYPGLLPNASSPTFDLSLDTKVFDTFSHTLLDLKTQTSLATFTLPSPEAINATGQLALQLDLTQDDATERFTGHATIEASNFSIQSPTLQGNGIALQAKTNFRNLSSDLPSDASTRTLIAALLPQLDFTLDWQANQLSTDTLTADWTGGSLSLSSIESALQTATSFGAGILTLDSIRLEQVYLENQHSGTLDQLEGTTTASALLEGVPLNFTTRQTIESPLENLSLIGEYTLDPATFTRSDILSRFDPTLAGLSLSSSLSAQGSFTASLDSADATLTLQLREAALDYPASKLSATGIQADLHLDSLINLNSGPTASQVTIDSLQAGDLAATAAAASLRIANGTHLQLDSATVNLFDGRAFLAPTEIPIDGSDFAGQLSLENLSLAQIAQYIDIFDGSMEGSVTGYLPYRLHRGNFELLRGRLTLPDGTPATLHYRTAGLLTANSPDDALAKPTFSERLLKFLKVQPDALAEQALGNITIHEFTAELFPEDTPETPIRIRLVGTAHSELAEIPVVITTQVHGSLSELYNFLIRLNSL